MNLKRDTLEIPLKVVKKVQQKTFSSEKATNSAVIAGASLVGVWMIVGITVEILFT